MISQDLEDRESRDVRLSNPPFSEPLGVTLPSSDLQFTGSLVAANDLQRLGQGRQAELFTWVPGRVVKLFRQPGAIDAARFEADAMRLLSSTDIPMPQFLDTVTVEGRPGIVMERLVGPDQLSALGRRPWKIWSVGTVLGRLHAQLHAVTAPEGLPSLKPLVRQDIEVSEWVPSDLKAIAYADLDHLPDGAAVCHWDFHPANVIETSDGPRIIDWAGVRRGHRLADVARTLMIIRGGALPPGAPLLVRWFAALARSLLAWRYLREYRRLLPFADSELKAWTRVNLISRLSHGIPEERHHLLAMIAAC